MGFNSGLKGLNTRNKSHYVKESKNYSLPHLCTVPKQRRMLLKTVTVFQLVRCEHGQELLTPTYDDKDKQ